MLHKRISVVRPTPFACFPVATGLAINQASIVRPSYRSYLQAANQRVYIVDLFVVTIGPHSLDNVQRSPGDHECSRSNLHSRCAGDHELERIPTVRNPPHPHERDRHGPMYFPYHRQGDGLDRGAG